MPATVKSKFSASFLAVTALKLLLSPIFIIIMQILAVKNQTDLGWILILAIIVYLLLIYSVAIELKVITVTAEGVIFHQILLNRKVVIAYSEIVHVHSSQAANLRRPGDQPVDFVAVTLDIELNNGETVFIYKNTINNFDEISEAIRRFRFGLD